MKDNTLKKHCTHTSCTCIIDLTKTWLTKLVVNQPPPLPKKKTKQHCTCPCIIDMTMTWLTKLDVKH